MLTSDPPFSQTRARPDFVASPDTLNSILGFLRRHFALGVITAIIALAAYTMQARLTAPHFVATAKLLVDPDAPAQLANHLASKPQRLSFPTPMKYRPRSTC